MSFTPRTSLQSFLETAKKALLSPTDQRPSPLTLVVGNESADLDSLCCAVLYAYIRSRAPSRSCLHVPLANLSRADLSLRPEMTAVLGHAGLRPSDLITVSDLPDGLLRAEDTRWVLVDHNALTGPLARYAPEVVGCVDHHVDEARVPNDAAPRIIEPCGSCMSLVVEEVRQDWDALTGQDAEGDDGLAMLGLAPIIVDTANLAATDKVKAKDIDAVRYLESKLRYSQSSTSRASYFDELSAIKEDLSQFSFRDVFRRDYKQWDESGLTLGISCVVQGLAYLVEKAGGPKPLLDQLSAWATECHLDVIAIMTTSHPHGTFQRHLLVWGRSPRGSATATRFAEVGYKRLGLHTWRHGELDSGSNPGDGTVRFAWQQDELAASRKQVAPLLREVMRTV
ncbi:hypothetical protein HIM_01549 [Hirsutella minnesotensis 3608]|nr:hypothetical protein HIM_01549 [Hirsutella minnesotensis 3608]